MSNFNPTQMTLDPPNRPDHLAGAVLLSLARPIGRRPPSGPIKAFFLAAISFGLLPILIWPRKFKERLAGEQQQIWHFMEWIALRTGDPESLKLRYAGRIGAPSPPFIISLIAGVLVTILISGAAATSMHNSPVIDRMTLWLIWNVCLCVIYTFHFLQVHLAKTGMDQLVRRINPIFQRYGITEIAARSMGFPGILWILAAAFGVYLGAWWAIPAALAGWAQRAYALNVSWNVRQDLSQRVQTILIRQRPAVNVPTPNSQRPVCSNALCGKPAISGAAFCTRCGTRLTDVRFQAVA